MDEAKKFDTGKPAYELLDSWVFDVLTGSLFDCGAIWDALHAQSWAYALQLASAAAGNYRALRHEIACVLAFGATKYGANNWRLGMKWSRVFGAACRHLAAFERGELRDPETGLHHLGHFGCCMMFLAVYERDGLGTNDLEEVLR